MARIHCFLYITVVIAVVSVSNSQLEYSDKKMGPYKLAVHRIDHCENRGRKLIFSDSTKITKRGRNTYTYSANITSLVPLDDNIQAAIDFAVWGNGGWRPHYLTFDVEQFCSSFRHYMPQLFQALISDFDIKDCPIPAGTYRVMNISLNNIKHTVSAMPYGVYRVDLNFKKNSTALGCERAYFDLLPKKDRPALKRKTNINPLKKQI
ncbi:unnamed protein product [Nezara viridula]|uniref:MD-2-related lipid-recognition domain-containing protein n=1 Tax=Nezara viridula TaxID=85310 RepID=A0A9P0EDI5_NEZVI|nr:unnamed protein product [Nezara viridula]